MLVWPTKDPIEFLDYDLDWSTLLGNDVILTSTWTCDPGIVLSNFSINFPKTLVWIAGGIDGTTYRVWNEVTTTSGRVEIKLVYIKVIAKQ